MLAKEGVSRFDPMGEKFDPNLHNALFEASDEGWFTRIHGRAVRLLHGCGSARWRACPDPA